MPLSVEIGNLAKRIMRVRMNKELRFWVDVAYQEIKETGGKHRNGFIRSILRDWESAGEVMRYRDADGTIAWKPTARMIERLTDAELEVREELEDSV
jgi:hypothetical protein